MALSTEPLGGIIMNEAVSRRMFLRGGRPEKASAIPPPFSHSQFSILCDGCNACVDACPLGLLATGADTRPYADFASSFCDFCGKCQRVCTRGALVETSPPWSIKAVITDQCLSAQAVSCRVCGDFCQSHALRFQPALGGKSFPVVNPSLCSGCGACVGPCPTTAIIMKG